MVKRNTQLVRSSKARHINPFTDFGFKRIFGAEFMESPNFTKREHELETNFDRWMYLLKHLVELEDLPDTLRNRVFEKLCHVAEIDRMSPKEKII